MGKGRKPMEDASWPTPPTAVSPPPQLSHATPGAASSNDVSLPPLRTSLPFFSGSRSGTNADGRMKLRVRNVVARKKPRNEARRFDTFLTRLALPQQSAATPPRTTESSDDEASTPPHGSTPTKPPTPAQPPPPHATGVTYQTFRDWRQRWTDYATMVDLTRLPQPKQLIKLRACLSLQMQRALEYTLQVSQDSSTPVEEVLDKLQEHVKGQNNEALRRRAFGSCKQTENETFDDFFVKLKSASEKKLTSAKFTLANAKRCGLNTESSWV
ncbi:hypothetical protein E2C01_081170 [Portunus trituberculatus]|uniref:Uncharacterized protein n=1 Tax=Portunus trituberculatus TaxID=210409 RepID=A0A5B7IXZ2_PORTR|nr:hypothetical protein [Portunus trituberculatus]